MKSIKKDKEKSKKQNNETVEDGYFICFGDEDGIHGIIKVPKNAKPKKIRELITQYKKSDEWYTYDNFLKFLKSKGVSFVEIFNVNDKRIVELYF